MRYLGSFPRLLAITAIVAAAGAPEEAAASEGGASFYLLGSGGPGAAVLPPLRGVFFDNTAFYYHGEAEAERQFVIGGNVVAGVDATIVADFATVMWVPTTDFAGGTLALAGAFAVGQPDVEVDVVLTGQGAIRSPSLAKTRRSSSPTLSRQPS